MTEGLKSLPAVFYRAASGAEPVRRWLRSLPAEDRKTIGDDIRDCEFAWPVGLPLSRPMGNGLFEVRSNLPSDRIARVLFMIAEGHMVLLHGFIKKNQKTPAQDLDLAIQRMKDVRRHGRDQ